MKVSKQSKRAVGLLLIFLTVVFLAFIPTMLQSPLRRIRIQRAIKEIQEGQVSKYWLQKAEKIAGSATTLEDAYQWLIDNEFKVLMWNPHKDRGWIGCGRRYTKDDETTHISYIVQGSMQLTEKSFLSDASWVDLIFRFDSEKNFQDVGFITRTYDLPK